MAHPPETVARARKLYVRDRQSLDAVADATGVGVATVRRWKAAADAAGDDWDRARSAGVLTGEGTLPLVQVLLEDYLRLHAVAIEALRDGSGINPVDRAEAMGRLADAFAKTMSAVGKANPQLSRLSVATDVLQRLGKYIAETQPGSAAALLDVLEPFAAELARDYA